MGPSVAMRSRERVALISGLPGIAKLLQMWGMTGGHLGDAGVTKTCHPWISV